MGQVVFYRRKNEPDAFGEDWVMNTARVRRIDLAGIARAKRRLVYAPILIALLLAMLGGARAQNSQPSEASAEHAAPQTSQSASEVSAEQPAGVDPDLDPRCDFNPPKPALIAADYAGYHVERNHGSDFTSPQQLTETATLVDGTRVSVVSDACVDSFGREFRFTFPHTTHAARDTAFWAAAASKALADLKLSSDVGNEVPELRDFLARAPKLHRKGSRVVQCHDLTQPDDGDCNWESHGSYILTIQHKGSATEVVVSIDYSA
jgi:hypothetical protein